MNHTENGFPQSFVDFPCPLGEDEGFVAFLGGLGAKPNPPAVLLGSMGGDIRLRYRSPVEVGLGRMIKFDHDFIGRAALEREISSPRRKMVTLVWNVEDIMDVHASQYRDGDPFRPMEPIEGPQKNGRHALYADQVLRDGKSIGISTGRMYSYYYRQMLSLCSIDVEHGEPDDEVAVLWGDPGTRQKEIRATVSRFPYLNESRNENVDVADIPCQARKD